MTSPTGHPDWQDYPVTQSSNVFPSFGPTIPPGVTSTGVFPATSFQSLLLLVQFSSGHGFITINHMLDHLGAQQVTEDFYELTTGIVLMTRLPIKAPYLRIDINNRSGANASLTTYGIMSTVVADRIKDPVGRQFVADTAHSLAASGTIAYNMGVIVNGESQIFFKPHDATGKLTCQVQELSDANLANYTFWEATAPTVAVNDRVMLPDQPVRVFITNTDAAGAHIYDVALVCPP